MSGSDHLQGFVYLRKVLLWDVWLPFDPSPGLSLPVNLENKGKKDIYKKVVPFVFCISDYFVSSLVICITV